jgi:DNA modification methylase
LEKFCEGNSSFDQVFQTFDNDVFPDSDVGQVEHNFKGILKFTGVIFREFKNCIRVTKNIEFVFNLVGIKGSSGIGENKVLDFYNSMIMFQTNLFKASSINSLFNAIIP